jgi:hypothetical protein
MIVTEDIKVSSLDFKCNLAKYVESLPKHTFSNVYKDDLHKNWYEVAPQGKPGVYILYPPSEISPDPCYIGSTTSLRFRVRTHGMIEVASLGKGSYSGSAFLNCLALGESDRSIYQIGILEFNRKLKFPRDNDLYNWPKASKVINDCAFKFFVSDKKDRFFYEYALVSFYNPCFNSVK